MSAIKTWSTTAAANDSAAPDGFPENMAPSGVNDACREMMAALATWYRDAQWIDLDHAPTFASATSFTIAGDVSPTYHVGRRLRLADSTTLYGTVTAVSYGAPNTTVTVLLDTGSLSASLSAVAVSLLSATDHAVPNTSLLRPAFLAYLGSANIQDITGDGTTYTIPFPTEGYDVGGGYDPGSGTFTAPAAGYYLLTGAITFQTADPNHTAANLNIATTDFTFRIWEGNPYAARAIGNDHITATFSTIAYLNVGDTAYVSIQVSGGGKSVDVLWGSSVVLPTYLTGRLLG
jgi:hypothetical protein